MRRHDKQREQLTTRTGLVSILGLLAAGCYQGVSSEAMDGAEGNATAADGAVGESSDGGADAGDDDAESEGGEDTGEMQIPFDPLPRASALAKVKDFMTGLPPTDEEHDTYVVDPTALRGMIDTWMTTPEFEARTIEIFDQLFQQQISTDNLAEYIDTTPNRAKAMNDRSGGKLVRSIADGFSRTAWSIVADGRPFHEIMTTRTFMLNVPQMVLLSWLDAAPRDDLAEDLPSWILQSHDGFSVGVRWTGNAVGPNQTLNPDGANFMTFWMPETPDAGCQNQMDARTTGRKALIDAIELMFRVPPSNVGCGTTDAIFTDADWELRPVTLRVAGADEQATAFYAVGAMRDATELVLHSDRVGFFTTLGFSANWQSNDSNQHRVGANQTLIVGLGRTFNPEDIFAPADGATIDEGHATPDTPCYGCHKDLDPLRDFMRHSYTYAGSMRPESLAGDLPEVAYFSVDGSDPVAGHGVGDLAAAMAGHERFAVAWTEKLCTMINADACDPTDPELTRIAGVFADANYDYRVLMAELMTSPLVTYDSRTVTHDNIGHAILPVSQDRFCRRMSLRLGIEDVCNLRGALDVPAALGKRMRALADGVPPVAYGRTAVLPFVSTAPDVFAAASAERLCQLVAEEWYGNQDGALLGPEDRDVALDQLVGAVMGLVGDDPRATAVRTLLDEHWTAALETGVTDVDALRSTFITACTSAPATSTAL